MKYIYKMLTETDSILTKEVYSKISCSTLSGHVLLPSLADNATDLQNFPERQLEKEGHKNVSIDTKYTLEAFTSVRISP